MVISKKTTLNIKNVCICTGHIIRYAHCNSHCTHLLHDRLHHLRRSLPLEACQLGFHSEIVKIKSFVHQNVKLKPINQTLKPNCVSGNNTIVFGLIHALIIINLLIQQNSSIMTLAMTTVRL